MGWDRGRFIESLASLADSSRAAYRRDLDAFVDWAERGDLHGPGDLTR